MNPSTSARRPGRVTCIQDRCAAAILRGLLRAGADDRGDVPGWVLVTVMSAGLVTAIWLVADDQLTAVLGRAIGSVTQP